MAEALATALEQMILANKIMPLQSRWADEIVFPYYAGLSIRNLPHTIVRVLDGKAPLSGLGSSPLDRRLWDHLDGGKIKRVVLFLTDGLGWRLLQEIMREDPATAQVVADLVGDGTLTPITSVAPSTTAAALPAIWTGCGPAATGMVGTELFLREYGALVSMLHFWPSSGRHRSEVLEDWGLEFDAFLPGMTLGEVLNTRRIHSYLLLEKSLFGSGLSRVMHRGIKQAVRHFGYTDLWIGLRDLLRKTRRERCFVNIYWGAVDGISHLHGTATEQSINEVRRQLTDLREALAGDGVGDGQTLFMLAADHGHTPVPDYINLADHPPLAEALRCGPGGEGRFAYLYLRYDYRDQVIEYLNSTLADRVTTLIPTDALRAGLFGPEAPYRESGPRLGDLGVVLRRGVALGNRPLPSTAAVSRHGGLSEREMLVPLIMRVL
jgi:hypothetical protein